MMVPLFFCLGFMFAVLYIDMVFDVSARGHRHTGKPLPPDVLEPIVTYYRYITKNPFLLIGILTTALASIIAEIRYALVPAWAGYASLALILLTMLTGVLKIIPQAQRLAAGKDSIEQQTTLVHGLLPFHTVMMVNVFLLIAVQLMAKYL